MGNEVKLPAVPGKPSEIGATLYKLRFKTGTNPDRWLMFYLNGDLDAAIVRGRKHCNIMNFKFIHVEQALFDLDEAERSLQGS
jgi:hypothetical protein